MSSRTFAYRRIKTTLVTMAEARRDIPPLPVEGGVSLVEKRLDDPEGWTDRMTGGAVTPDDRQ